MMNAPAQSDSHDQSTQEMLEMVTIVSYLWYVALQSSSNGEMIENLSDDVGSKAYAALSMLPHGLKR